MEKTIKYIDQISIFLVLSLFLVIKPDILVISVFFLVPLYLISTKRIKLFYHLLIAFSITLIWIILSRNHYSYNQDLLSIAGLNMFPLFAWTIGLLAVYMIYSHYEHFLKKPTTTKKILLFTIIYWPLLLITETLGRHVF